MVTEVGKTEKIFTKIYAGFHRNYADYISEVSGNNYIKFATIIPKVSVTEIPLYANPDAAFTKSETDRYLTPISGFYLKERPMLFLGPTQDLINYVNYKMGIGPVFDFTSATIVLIINLFDGKDYTNYYTYFDPEKMMLLDYCYLLDNFIDDISACADLQKKLTGACFNLNQAHNLIAAVLQSKPTGNIITQLDNYYSMIQGYITDLQDNPNYILKVSLGCGASDDTYIQIDILNAISLSKLPGLADINNAQIKSDLVANLANIQAQVSQIIQNAKTLISCMDLSNIDPGTQSACAAILAAPVMTTIAPVSGSVGDQNTPQLPQPVTSTTNTNNVSDFLKKNWGWLVAGYVGYEILK